MDNPFKKLFPSLNVLGEPDESAVGVDIGTSSIKVVEIKKKKGKAVLQTYGAISLGPYAGADAGRVTNLSVEKTSEALLEVLKQSGIGVGSAAFSIPVQSSLIFMIELPSQLKESEIPTIVPTEARKYIPVPISEVAINYFVLPKKAASFEEANNPDASLASEKTQVLVVATQNDAVARYKSIVLQSKMEASFYEIETFSSIRASFEHELSLVLLMDFGASRTKLSLVEFGMVKNSHTINRGGADVSASISQSLSIPFAEAEKMKKEFGLLGNNKDQSFSDIIQVHLNYIFSETNNVLLSYERAHDRTISKVILTGGGALLKGLKEKAEENFKTEIEIGNSFSKVGSPAFLKKVLENMGPEFAVSLGLALRKLQ
ncbi:type IV pilus assembly protein PilM [Candidatus Nomurabacteria bacterium]|nr:type IV pilus assembly protein PilM [Candidatus Nomurabacteria bacterium]